MKILSSFGRWLRRQWHKIPGGTRLRYISEEQGHWRVLYPDGNRTTRMFYREAKNYAEIFGGKVIHDEPS
jgi:hypothetical protein